MKKPVLCLLLLLCCVAAGCQTVNLSACMGEKNAIRANDNDSTPTNVPLQAMVPLQGGTASGSQTTGK